MRLIALMLAIGLVGCSTVKPKLVQPTPDNGNTPVVKVQILTF